MDRERERGYLSLLDTFLRRMTTVSLRGYVEDKN